MTTPSPLDIRITRRLPAPPHVVFAQWLDAEALKDWFTPETYIGVSASAEGRVGGEWRVEFHTPTGATFVERGVYRELVPCRKLVMSLVQSVPHAPELTITVTFEADADGTLMRFHLTGLDDLAHRDGLAEGWAGCFDKLATRLAEEMEIRALFDDWFEASSRKDLEASMAPIATGIVSYEHSAPLEVRDIGSLRNECRKGFDRAGPEFRWDIPDLRIIVRGDIAVTWGLNRMADHAEGVLTGQMWSRGTRVFQRLDGRWQMIHQHVSFPVDPESGHARMDLVPQAANGGAVSSA